MPQVLDIYLKDRLVGSLTNLPGDKNLFVFDDEYVSDTMRPALSQGFLRPDRSINPDVPITSRKVPPFFSNLLPENDLRQYLAARGKVSPARDFPLLWLLGEDLPGAVIVRDHDGEPLPPEDRSIETSGSAATRRKLRFSLAGVQMKMSAIRSAPGGLTIPVSGIGGQWIVKLPSTKFPRVPENEWSMMTFARDVGIETPELYLSPTADIGNLPDDLQLALGDSLVLRRFDRTESGDRVHIEDFAQVFRHFPDAKYKGASNGSIAQALATVAGSDSVSEFVKRVVFNIGIGNADMHLKNWSLLYKDGRTPKLAPAYDYVSTIQYIPDDTMGLSVSGTKLWEEMSEDLFVRFARKSDISTGVVLGAVREMVEKMHESWPRLRDTLPIGRESIKRIEAHQKRIPLFTNRRLKQGVTFDRNRGASEHEEVS